MEKGVLSIIVGGLTLKRLVAAGAAIVIAGVLVIGVRTAKNAMAWGHFVRKPVRDEERAAVRDIAPSVTDVSFRTKDGLTLRGWYVPSKNGAAVVLVHGGGENRTQLLPELRALSGRGYGVLAYDSRAAGESDGELVTFGDREQLDLTAALDFLSQRQDVTHGHFGAIGFSIGGSTVAMVASRDPRIAAVLLHATYTSLEEEVRVKFGKWGPFSYLPAVWALRRMGLDLDNVRPIEHIRAIAPRPLFMVTGGKDDDTPVPVMEQLFAAAGEPKSFWVIAEAGHGGYAAAQPEEYARRLVAFFTQALPPST